MSKMKVLLTDGEQYRMVGTGYEKDGFVIERREQDALGIDRWVGVTGSGNLRETFGEALSSILFRLLYFGVRP